MIATYFEFPSSHQNVSYDAVILNVMEHNNSPYIRNVEELLHSNAKKQQKRNLKRTSIIPD